MSILTATRISQSFGALDVFSGISVSIPGDGKIGLVGPNGIGKTTLLLILAGLSKPSSGSLNLARGGRLGYLPQEASQAFIGKTHSVYAEMLGLFDHLRADEERLRLMEGAMEAGDQTDDLLDEYSKLQLQFELAGGYTYDLRIQQVLTGLGFGPENWGLSLAHLSGGQKTRVLLAQLLLEEPDLLILDEPTNHLDVEAIEWLEGTLKVWPGAVLLVSHDRFFLDKVTNTIWEMNRTGIETYRGNYTDYLQQRQERWERRQREFEAFKERIEKDLDFIRRNISGQRTQMAQGKLSRLGREVEAIRAGGLDVIPALRSRGWLKVSAESDLRRPADTLAELEQRIGELRGPIQPPTVNIRLHASHRSGTIVLRARELHIGYPDTPLFAVHELELQRQECAALIGPNGSGKTTFLRTILGRLKPLSGEVRLGASLQIGYFAQAHDGLHAENTILDELLRHRPMQISEARDYLARYLFRKDDVYKTIEALSGGERGRLALAILALQDTNFLLLDEPTNHLDIPAQEVLQAALEQFEGTILLVSHDRYLVNRLATQVWEIEDRLLRVHEGGYAQYLEQHEKDVAARKEAAAAARQSMAIDTGSNGGQPSKNTLQKQAKALQEVEAQISAAEAQLARLGEALQQASQAQSFDKIQRLSVEYAVTEKQLAHLLEKWEKLVNE